MARSAAAPFINGVKRFAVVGLSTAAIVEALMPNYAAAQQVRKDDERIKASYETLPSPDGNGYIRGYFVRPFSADTRDATPAKLPGIIVIHENRGLNPHTEDVARRFALENFMAFAPDGLIVGRRLSGRRLQGRPDLRQDRQGQDDAGFPGRGALAEGAARLHRQDRRHRLLLWRRRGQ